MDNSYNKLRSIVLAALQEQREKSSEQRGESHRVKLLGMLLKRHLDQMGIDEETFAHNLGLSTDVITLFLSGELPNWLISDEALDRFAALSGYDINVFRVILNRPPKQLDEADVSS